MMGDTLKMTAMMRLFIAASVVAVTAFSSGGASWAQQDQAQEKTQKDPATVKKDAAAAARSRALRDAAIKRRQETKKYIQKVVEGQAKPGANDPGTGGGGK